MRGPAQAPAGLEQGAFYAPTVLTGVTPEMRIMREEIFGPVLPIVVVDGEDEAIALANDSDFGLGASVWTSDRSKGERIARGARVGDGLDQRPHVQPRRMPVLAGGVKESGLGRTHSKFGLYECVNVKLQGLGAVDRAQRLVASIRRDPRKGASPDGGNSLRAPFDQGRRPALRRRPTAEARRPSGARRRPALAPAAGSRVGALQHH